MIYCALLFLFYIWWFFLCFTGFWTISRKIWPLNECSLTPTAALKSPCPWKEKRTGECRNSGHHGWSVVASFSPSLFVFLQLFDFQAVLIPLFLAAVWLSGSFVTKRLFATSFHRPFCFLHIPFCLVRIWIGRERIENWSENLQGFHAGFAIDGLKRVNWLSISFLLSSLLFSSSFSLSLDWCFCSFDYLLLFWFWIYANTS